jgi:hypothetical protein
MKKQILTNNHPYWEEYIRKLSFALNAHTEFASECSCNGNLRITKLVLSNIPKIDVKGSLEYIRSNYGECDCKALNMAT